MFDWVPIESYTPLFHYICLLVVTIIFIHTHITNLTDQKAIFKRNIFGFIFVIFVLLYMGLRPIHGVFIDMTTYNEIFEMFKLGRFDIGKQDIAFDYLMKYSSAIMSAHSFFFVCASLYIIPLYLVSKKWFKEYWFYSFLLLVVSFSFWSYGTNGIRNGIASSLFLLGVSRERKIWQIVLIILAISFHKSILLPTIGFILANIYNKPKYFIFFWFFSILLSLAGGSFWENFFSNIGLDDNRLSYLTTASDKSFSRKGFRWDFLLYSSVPTLIGWYFIVKKGFVDRKYFLIYNTYLFSNALWILVIRANFSNRFAYLSWFMMALIIIYPLLKKFLIPKQHQLIGTITILYFGFTFILLVILK
ncbi:EpsG family protein [Weeksellaceae bacterium TAE3-ERU29]|nr:EpsG family protein [Weeksellaceae bacterium TAE3-ERU29]